ncbi:MAG TPA: deaminase [Burkholderiaceae bacterium]|nr:deaminase [Burkholderiaceae bacterium]
MAPLAVRRGHAPIAAMLRADLGRPNLKGSVVYASGHPCPMCLAAMVIAGVDAVYYAFDNHDAAPYGLSSEAAYQALWLPLVSPPLPLTRLDTGVTAAQFYMAGFPAIGDDGTCARRGAD